jgi:hypothetical protein
VSSNEGALIAWQTTADAAGRYWTVDLQSPEPLTETNQMANWGTVVWAAARSPSLTYQSGYSAAIRSQFAATGNLLDVSDPNLRAINDEQPAFAFAVNFGGVAGSASFTLGHVRTPLVSYGQAGTPLLPLWTQYWSGWQPMTAAFLTGAASARQRAAALDNEIQSAATTAAQDAGLTGTAESGYAALCSLALRQCYGGTELAIGPDGSPWLLGKEISSDGDTNTVDIFDQAFLAWLWLDPELIPLVMAPILDWCSSPAWQNASAWAGIAQPYYCVHDLGVYPVASGLVPGQGEQMPIEESAGMLIMAAAYARAVGASAAEPFLSKWQALWAQWANYLLTQVPAPAAQLTTDDWVTAYRVPTGSVNLGIKALVGLKAAGQIGTIIGDANAGTWSNAATSNVNGWVNLSPDYSAHGHLNIQHNASGTWSCLYNAYYDTVIGGTPLVPQQVVANQASFYSGLSQLTNYGLPLQSTGASDINKAAWLFFLPAWFSSYSNSYSIINELMTCNVAYVNATPSLVPYGDRYHTTTAIEVTGIQAHPTLGAVFALLATGGPAFSGLDRTASAADAEQPAPARSSTPSQPAIRASKPARHRHAAKKKRKKRHKPKNHKHKPHKHEPQKHKHRKTKRQKPERPTRGRQTSNKQRRTR